LTEMPVIDVIVPHGYEAGEALTIETADGQIVSVALPPGYFPGDVLPVEMQSLPPSPVTNAPCARKSGVSRTRDFDVTIPHGYVSGEIFAVETAWGAFDVTVPDGCGGGCAITCALPVPEDEAVAPADEAPCAEDDAYAYRYRPGQKVQVLRTDGSYSSAIIDYGFDGVFEVLYAVILESGLQKPAVPESEMYAADDANDPAFGEHLASAMEAMLEAEMMDSMLNDSCSPYD